jgi:hypothetical protein
MHNEKEEGLTYQNCYKPECPSPALVLCQKAADNGCDDLLISIFTSQRRHACADPTHWSEKGSKAEQGGSQRPLLQGNDIGNGPAANGERRGAGKARDEPAGQELADVPAQGTPHGEGGEDDVAGVVDDEAPVRLGRGRDDERAQREAEKVQTDSERSKGGARNAKVSDEACDAGRDDGGGEIPALRTR